MAVATTTAPVMIVVVVVPISAVVVLVLIVILLVVLLLMLLMVMHLLGILLRILQPVPDGGIVLATSAAATTSSTATIIHGRGHSTQDRMVQVIVERRRRVTHASHRKATRETALVVQARNLRLLLLLVGRHSLLLRVVLVRELWLLVMVVVGVTYILIIAIAVMSHRRARPVDLQVPKPIVEVRFGDYVRAAAVDHRWSAVRGTFVAKVWHRSSAVRSSASATPSSAVVPSEPRVVTTAVLRLLLLRRGGLLGHEYRRVCGEVVSCSGRPQRGKARFGTALPLATSALLIHADCSSCCCCFSRVLLFLLRSVQTESVLFSTIILCVTPWHNRKHS